MFTTDGVEKILDRLPNKRQTLVHGDFDLQNILYDPNSMKITGLLDFDSPNVASPIDEYFYSFASINGILVGPFEGGEMDTLRLSILSGNFPEPSTPGVDVNWIVARTLNEELKRVSTIRPIDLAGDGVGEYAGLYWFTQNVCPPYFLMPRWLAKRTPEQLTKSKAGIESELWMYLD